MGRSQARVYPPVAGALWGLRGVQPGCVPPEVSVRAWNGTAIPRLGLGAHGNGRTVAGT